MKLFEPYLFVTSGWVQKAGVSGLGLSMAKRYIEGVGGTIGVESTEGEGSTFFFSVPFPLVPFDPSIDRAHSQLYSESSLALLEKAELSSSLSSSAVTQEPTTDWQLSIGRENPNTRNKEMGIDVVTVDSANFQRKVLLVEDTRINRVSKFFYLFVFLPVLSQLYHGWFWRVGGIRILTYSFVPMLVEVVLLEEL